VEHPPPPDLGNKRNKFYHEAFSCSYSALDCVVVSSFSFALGSVWSTRFFVELLLFHFACIYCIGLKTRIKPRGMVYLFSTALLS